MDYRAGIRSMGLVVLLILARFVGAPLIAYTPAPYVVGLLAAFASLVFVLLHVTRQDRR